MIGIIVTGHGRFAEGITSSIEMIAGAQADYEAVNFLQEESVEDLEVKLTAAYDKLSASCDGVILCCDLLGGSPFKSSVIMSVKQENAAVVAGINLPSLLEMLFDRLNETSALALADAIIAKGSNALIKFSPAELRQQDNFEEGI
jgi:PTS system N-acetylgalactosamine-specific IIA component